MTRGRVVLGLACLALALALAPLVGSLARLAPGPCLVTAPGYFWQQGLLFGVYVGPLGGIRRDTSGGSAFLTGKPTRARYGQVPGSSSSSRASGRPCTPARGGAAGESI